MSGKPTSFPIPADVLGKLPDQAASHNPPTTFGVALVAASAGDHFAPHADVTLPDDATTALADHGAHIPAFVTDWLL
ncbi:hypothetical protein [Mesorhizobium sp.]|uniref:hypothetical protein n=1 Tax=Mesorhizobium sp. TaxID=1871066 RepID=UPI0012147505|nr:hypothetical protein [Mesorhizobium sp.]TIQ10730.1 MAG: hypothetical protein E5X50_07860 [Mesorhizobium sp.]